MIPIVKTKSLVKKSTRQAATSSSRVLGIKRTTRVRPKAAANPLEDDFLVKLEALQKPFRARGELVTASREESDLLARMIAGEAA